MVISSPFISATHRRDRFDRDFIISKESDTSTVSLPTEIQLPETRNINDIIIPVSIMVDIFRQLQLESGKRTEESMKTVVASMISTHGEFQR